MPDHHNFLVVVIQPFQHALHAAYAGKIQVLIRHDIRHITAQFLRNIPRG